MALLTEPSINDDVDTNILIKPVKLTIQIVRKHSSGSN